MEKVQIYFEAALAMPAEKRNAFLADICGEENKIRHQVEALLNADSQSKIWDSDEPFDITLEQTNTFQADDEIGHYRLLRNW